MSGQTKKYKIENYDRIAEESTRLMLALNDVLTQGVSWSAWHRESPTEQGKYRAGISRLDSPAGGLLLLVYRHPNQADYTSVHALDTFDSGYTNQAIRDAIHEARFVWHDEHTETAAQVA